MKVNEDVPLWDDSSLHLYQFFYCTFTTQPQSICIIQDFI